MSHDSRFLCVFQVIIWVERRTGLVACTSTHLCPSDQARVDSETFSGPISFSMPATSVTSTMVSAFKMYYHYDDDYYYIKTIK